MSFDIPHVPLKGATFESSSQVFDLECSMFSSEKTIHLQPSQYSCDKCLIDFEIRTIWVFFRWHDIQLHFDNDWIIWIHIFVVVKRGMNHACDGIFIISIPYAVHWS